MKKIKRIGTIVMICAALFIILGIVLMFSVDYGLGFVLLLGGGSFFACIFIFILRLTDKYCKKCYELVRGSSYQWKAVKKNANRENDGSYKYTVDFDILVICKHCEERNKIFRTFTSKVDYEDCVLKMQNFCSKKLD